MRVRLQVVKIIYAEANEGKKSLPLGIQFVCSQPIKTSSKQLQKQKLKTFLVDVQGLEVKVSLSSESYVYLNWEGLGNIKFFEKNNKLYADLTYKRRFSRPVKKNIFFGEKIRGFPAGLGFRSSWKSGPKARYARIVSGGSPSLGKGSK